MKVPMVFLDALKAARLRLMVAAADADAAGNYLYASNHRQVLAQVDAAIAEAERPE